MITVVRAVAPEPHRRQRRLPFHGPADVLAKRLGLVAVLPAGFRIELRQGVGETLESLERKGIVDSSTNASHN